MHARIEGPGSPAKKYKVYSSPNSRLVFIRDNLTGMVGLLRDRETGQNFLKSELEGDTDFAIQLGPEWYQAFNQFVPARSSTDCQTRERHHQGQNTYQEPAKSAITNVPDVDNGTAGNESINTANFVTGTGTPGVTNIAPIPRATVITKNSNARVITKIRNVANDPVITKNPNATVITKIGNVANYPAITNVANTTKDPAINKIAQVANDEGITNNAKTAKDPPINKITQVAKDRAITNIANGTNDSAITKIANVVDDPPITNIGNVANGAQQSRPKPTGPMEFFIDPTSNNLMIRDKENEMVGLVRDSITGQPVVYTEINSETDYVLNVGSRWAQPLLRKT